VLSSTNLIENLFSRVREVSRRVKRWQGGAMILRWTAAGVLEAQRQFRKVAGYRAIPKRSLPYARIIRYSTANAQLIIESRQPE
jgi:putative transposase